VWALAQSCGDGYSSLVIPERVLLSAYNEDLMFLFDNSAYLYCRYYIRPETLEIKIPATYPASGITRNLVRGVAYLVLDQSSASNLSQTSGFE